MRLFVPGRLCLFGEHTDWAGAYRQMESGLPVGQVIVCGTNQGLYADVSTSIKQLQIDSTDRIGRRWSISLPLKADTLLEKAQQGGFFSYALGTAYQIMRRHPVEGICINNNKTTLPLGIGLSSSAAICVLVARAFNVVYNLGLNVKEEMELAYLGETTTPSQCGRMDQICAYGQQPMYMTFDGDKTSIASIAVRNPLKYLIIDLKSGKDTVRILKDLNRHYPRPSNAIGTRVHRYLGIISGEHTTAAKTAMESGRIEELGRLMNRAQTDFDNFCKPASPQGLTSPILDGLLKDRFIQEHSIGMKGVGSHGDGCAQILVKNQDCRDTILDYVTNRLGLEGLPLDIEPDNRR